MPRQSFQFGSLPSDQLRNAVISCRICPRLVNHREAVAVTKVRRFMHEDYWGKPVHGFGNSKAKLLIIGLAPGAQGSNRTGRAFTGDRSGELLYQVLYDNEFCNQPESIRQNDGLQLTNCYITAVVRCAPPRNKPLPEEFASCRPYLIEEIRLLRSVCVVVALGKLAFDHYFKACQDTGHSVPTPKPRFSHGGVIRLPWGVTLVSSYHPSQQNTQTGRLTHSMFNDIFAMARSMLS
ncbi:MAG TPA: uracil-DNA glycosylase [Verrucomicrobiales bacterium]|nr:uracil-DNA glycosylase [Verrucomicrobiales bacterium]